MDESDGLGLAEPGDDELPPRLRPEGMPPDRRLALQLAAYRRLMDEIVPESQYWLLGRRENRERVRFYAAVIERAALGRGRQDG